MENAKPEKMTFQSKKSKEKKYFRPMTFKLLAKNKNYNLIKFFQESKGKIRSHNTSRNKENINIITNKGPIKNIKDLLLHNINKSKKKNSHSSNNSKLKGERNMKKTFVIPYQTFNKTSINQWKTKYNTKNNSSKIQYTNPDITKNISIPSPKIRQYSKEYNIINFKQRTMQANKYNKKENINILSNLQMYINKKDKSINKKNRIKNKNDDLYYKLENIKTRCHHLLKHFTIQTNHLKK